MSFMMPKGTRGLRRSAVTKTVIKWVNGLTAGRIARTGKAFGTMPALVLVTVGRKSGKERRSPLAYFQESPGKWLIVAAYAGAVENPAWYYNLAANPDRVSIELDGNTHHVAVEELHGQERELAWEQITRANSRFAGYQAKTDRELPIIRLAKDR